jgi:hypothetical protein
MTVAGPVPIAAYLPMRSMYPKGETAGNAEPSGIDGATGAWACNLRSRSVDRCTLPVRGRFKFHPQFAAAAQPFVFLGQPF